MVAILITLLVILTVAMYNWILSPQMAYLRAAQLQGDMTNEVIAKTKMITGRIKKKKSRLEKLAHDFEQTATQFFLPEQAKDFFSSLEISAEETQCTISSLILRRDQSVSGDEDPNGISIVAKSASVDFTGGYDNILGFLGKLSGYQQRISIADLRIEMAPAGARQLECSAIITIYVINDMEILEDENG